MAVAKGDKAASAAAGPSESALGPLDKMFWWVEKEAQPMTVGNIWEMSEEIDVATAVELFGPLMKSPEYRRYRQICSERRGTVYFVDDPNYDVHDHFSAYQLPAPGGRDELEDFVSRQFSASLDRSKPMWHCDVVTGRQEGGTVLVFRIHHAVSDGQGNIRAMLSVLHSANGTDMSGLQYHKAKGAKPMELTPTTVQERVLAMVKNIVASLVAWAIFLYHTLLYILLVLRMVIRPKISFYRDPKMMNPKKKVSWSHGIDMEQVKLVKQVYKVTVNDVFMTCATKALRSYLVENGKQVQEPMCCIPVSMRPPENILMNNESTIIYTVLPTLEADSEACLMEVHNRMRRLKDSSAPYIAYYVLSALYSIPYVNKILFSFKRRVFDWYCSRVGCVLTNVPGPQVPLVLGGYKFLSYVPFVPQHGAGVVGMGIVTYVGKAHFGVHVEDSYISGGPRDIVDRFVYEFEQLYMLAAKKKAAEKLKDE